jgi:glycosyltransferase involved in cell wall biosynthesis
MTLANAFDAMLVAGHVEHPAFPAGYFGKMAPQDLRAYGRFPWISRNLQLWRTFSTVPEQEVPWAIYSGSMALFARPRIHGPAILNCHTPPRDLFDQREFLLARMPLAKRPLMQAYLEWYERVYRDAITSMDKVVAMSATVQERLRTYVGVESTVIHPPCDTSAFTWLGQEGYYLSMARLTPLKRVRLIGDAFARMPDKQVVFISGGEEQGYLEGLAAKHPNISILGWVSEARLRSLMGSCIASIYIPRDEDFGISPVESMAAGKPVIGVREGGLLETVVHGETGWLLPADPTLEDLIDAVHRLDGGVALAMRSACRDRAAMFDQAHFLEQYRNLLPLG